MFSKFVLACIRFNKLLILLLIGVSVFFASHILNLEIKTNNEVLLNKESQNFREYQDFIDSFNSDRLLFILFQGNLLTSENLNQIDWLTNKLEGDKAVTEVISLTNVDAYIAKLFSLKASPAYDTWINDKGALPEELKELLLTNKMFEDNLISDDWTKSLALVYLDQNISEFDRNRLVSLLEEVIPALEKPSLSIDLIGIPVEEYRFLTTIKADQKQLVPLILLVLIGACFVFFSGYIASVTSVMTILLTLLWTMGSVSFLKIAINPITSLLSPVVMIISLAHVVHIMGYLSKVKKDSSTKVKAVLEDIYKQIGVPAFIAAITTCLGFIVLLMNPNPAVQQFGKFAALGSLYSYLISFIISTFMIQTFWSPGASVSIRFIDSFMEPFASFIMKYRTQLLMISFIVIGVAIWGVQYLTIDTRLSSYLKKEASMTEERNVLDRSFNGSSSLEVVLTSDKGAFYQKKYYDVVLRAHEAISQINFVQRVNGYDQFLESIYHLFENESDKNADQVFLDRFRKKIKAEEENKLERFLFWDGSRVRLNCLLLDRSTNEILVVKKEIERILKELLPPEVSFYVTGREFLFADMSENLVRQQKKSILFAALLMGGLIFFFLRSLPYSLLGFAAMLLPILVLQGGMSWLHIPINTATVMISSVAMGLLVDDTIHFLYSFKNKCLVVSQNIQGAISKTLFLTGSPIVLTSLILMVGFSMGLRGNVVPTVQFSLLLGSAAFLGLLTNLVLLPLILIQFERTKVFK